MMKRKNLLKKTETSANAARLAKDAAKSREGRDSLTRVGRPTKGIDTQGRQWRRWSP